MKLDKLKIYNYIYWFLPYLLFITLVLNSLFDFGFLFSLLVPIPLLTIIVFSFFQYRKLLKKQNIELKIELEKLQNEAKNMKSSSTLLTPEFVVSFAKKMLFSSEGGMNRNELFIDHLLEKKKQESEAIITAFQKSYFKKILESLQILLYFIDKEEYELIKFLSIKRKQHFLFWSILQAIVISLSLTIGFLFVFARVFLLSSFLFLVIFSLNMLLKDIKTLVNKKFQNGLNRYHKNKKIFVDYQINLNLLCNNHRLRSFDQFKQIAALLKLANSKIDYYKEIIKPYYFYVKKYEIVSLLGIFLGIVTVIIQETLLEISITLFNFDVINIFLFLLLFYAFIINPTIQYRNSLKIDVLSREEGKKLKENLEDLKRLQYIFVKNLESMI